MSSCWVEIPYKSSVCRAAAARLGFLFSKWTDAETNAEEIPVQESLTEQAGRLFDTYGDNILRLAYSYLHNMNDAEDILQDTLIQYLRAAPQLKSPDHEKAWLLRVAANLSKNRIDYNRVRQTDDLQETLISEDREDLSYVWGAVKQLPEKYREVIHLFYQEGYSTKEIAKVLKRKESTVRSDLKRGRERLRSLLKEEYDFG